MKYFTLFFLFLTVTLKSTAQNIIQQADSLLQTGNYKKASTLLDNYPNKTVTVLNKLGTIYQQTGNYKKAILNYTKSLELQKSVLIKERLAKSYQNYGNLEKAIPIFKELLTEAPNNHLLKYYVAKLFYTKKQYTNSRLLFEELQVKDNTNPNYTYFLGQIFQKTKNIKKAKRYFLKTISLDSSFIKPYTKLVKIYAKKKQYDSTFYYLNYGLKIQPKHKFLNQIKAKIQFIYKEYKNVIKQVNLLDSLKYNSKYYQQLQGLSYYYTKNFYKAQKNFQKILVSGKADENTLFYLSLSHKELKEYDLALMYLNLSIEMQQPQLDKEYYNLGLIYKKFKKPKKAIIAFKESLKQKEYNKNALYELAILSENYYKDKRIALKLYQKYILNFEGKDKRQTAFVKQQINNIKIKLFYKK